MATQPLIYLLKTSPFLSCDATIITVLPFGVHRFPSPQNQGDSNSHSRTPRGRWDKAREERVGPVGFVFCWGCSMREICGFRSFQDVLFWGKSQAGSCIMNYHNMLCILWTQESSCAFITHVFPLSPLSSWQTQTGWQTFTADKNLRHSSSPSCGEGLIYSWSPTSLLLCRELE